MPLSADGGPCDGLAHGLVQDVITRLAKLRSVKVIARGSVYVLSESGIADKEAGRLLNADYLATGSLQRCSGRITVTMELIRTADDQIVWADSFSHAIADTFCALDEIGNQIVVCIASEIEAAERNRAVLKHPQSLDAWESFHRGLWHMYRFTSVDNDAAQLLFRRAIAMDPTFARAYAGLSFTHFQNAFLHHRDDRHAEVAQAFEAAGQSLVADERDPAAHWAMGRALWLRGADEGAAASLETSVALSPNFTLGHYSLAFVNSQSGDAQAAIASADISRHLSPFDPLLFGMLGARAMALFRLGAYEEAAEWAIRAAARPNAHVHILAIAAHCLAVAERIDEARAFAAMIHKAVPDYRVEHYFAAFRFPAEAQGVFRKGAAQIGMG